MTSYATFVKVAANDPSWNDVQLPRKRGRSLCNLTTTAEELPAAEVLPLYINRVSRGIPPRASHLLSGMSRDPGSTAASEPPQGGDGGERRLRTLGGILWICLHVVEEEGREHEGGRSRSAGEITGECCRTHVILKMDLIVCAASSEMRFSSSSCSTGPDYYRCSKNSRSPLLMLRMCQQRRFGKEKNHTELEASFRRRSRGAYMSTRGLNSHS